MNSDWANFLTQNGAIIENNHVAGFGELTDEQTAALENNVLCDLSHLGLIKISGADAQTFLQGQFSNDVKEVTPSQSQLNSYNSPKGRMYASFRLYQFGDDYLMQLPSENIEPTLKRLQMFVMRSAVKLEDISDEMVAIGISGPQAKEILAKQFNDTPSAINGVVSWDRGLMTQLAGPQPRFIVVAPIADARAYWETLSQHSQACGYQAWTLLDIHAGIPSIYLNTREEFVAQMVNFHSIGGVNFKKGCYPGQEIVARMHYLGKLKKRMYRIHIDTAELPAPNTAIFVAGKEHGQSVGQLVDSAMTSNGVEALAVLQINGAENDNLCLDSTGNPAIHVLELPYEVSNEA